MYSFIEEVAKNQANIKVIGIGGGGCNAVERMLTREMNGVEFIACNTDMQSLQQYHAQTSLQLGSDLTRGLGAGGNPKIGKAAAFEDEEMIRSHLTGADMVFVTAGMGGGTGTGGAPVITKIAQDLGILTIAVVTLPFKFEGQRRMRIAETGIRDLEDFVDTLIVIPNEKLLAAVEPDTTVKDAFTKADEILCNAVQGISDLITEPGVVNVDFADVRTIMTGMGKAILGTGTGEGETRAVDAVEAAISSPLLENLNINGARGILLNITSGDDLGMLEMNQACDIIHRVADEDALIIFGHVSNPEYQGKMKITVIATGFEEPKVRERSRPAKKELMSFAYSESETSTDLEQDTETEKSVPEKLELQHIQVVQEEVQSSQIIETEPDNSDSDDETNPELEATNPAFFPEDTVFEPDNVSTHEQESVEEIEPSELQEKPGHLHVVNLDPILDPALAVSVKPANKINRPELELTPKNSSIQDDYPSVPDFSKRDLTSGNYKKETNLSNATQRIYYGDINTPAFLRRKAD